jgi:hypothetical protein
MEYKGIRYSVVQTIGKAFRWTVNLADCELTGEVRNRNVGILEAIRAIDKDNRRIRAAERKAERESKRGDQS